jgi:hypothetical protein
MRRLDERPVPQIGHRLLQLACVFITIGPCQATGSSIGAPEISRNRTPSGPACTVTSSPVPKRISVRSPDSRGC